MTLPDIAQQLLRLHTPSTASNNDCVYNATGVFSPSDTIVVMNKIDLLSLSGEDPSTTDCRHVTHVAGGTPFCWISCKTGEGVQQFMEQFKDVLEIL